MLTRLVSVCLALTLALAGTSTASAGQSPPRASKGSWDAVKAVAAGEEVAAELKTGGAKRGTFYVADDLTLSLLNSSGTVTVLRREDIRKVYLYSGVKEKTRLLSGIGVGVGLFAGLLVTLGVGLKQGSDRGAKKVVATVATPVGIGAGGGLGYALGRKLSKKLIYQA